VSQREPVETLGGLRASLSLLRRNPDFRRLYLASFISRRRLVLLVSLVALALEFTGSAVSVSLLIVAQEIPFFLMSPVGGHLADRMDRRFLMVGSDATRAVLCLGFLLVHDASTMWVAYLLLASIAFQRDLRPCPSATFPNMVEAEDLGPANALFGSLWGTMLALGAALGGIVAATLGQDAAFVADALSFAVSALLIARIRRPFSEDRAEGVVHAGIVPATAETVRYARRTIASLACSPAGGFGLAAGFC
jgi:MFS family permease